LRPLSVAFRTHREKSLRNKGLALSVRRVMDIDRPVALQIIVAWRDNKWVVLREAAEVGCYAYRPHAMDMARTIAAEAQAQGRDCYMLVREQDGRWGEQPCPKPARDGPAG
jgi:hypothetical protein